MLRIKVPEFKIGRNDQNDLQILNPLISGLHSTIRRSYCADTGQMVVEVADSSSNGTFINGKLVSECKLTGNLDR
jgi:pSer/pThr/pTyr-binding forkhead associated (FHA) protein